MAYFIRVLGKDAHAVPLHVLREALAVSELAFEVRLREGEDEAWRAVELFRRTGRSVARIRRLLMPDPPSAAPELQLLLEALLDERPASAAAWLNDYLRTVRVIYELEILPTIDEASGWSALHVVQGAIWEWAGGILHSDGEGFTNENGYFVLWRFHDDAHGAGNMAILEDGEWIEFEMDLGNLEQRAAFLEGRVPEGAQEGALSSP